MNAKNIEGSEQWDPGSISEQVAHVDIEYKMKGPIKIKVTSTRNRPLSTICRSGIKRLTESDNKPWFARIPVVSAFSLSEIIEKTTPLSSYFNIESEIHLGIETTKLCLTPEDWEKYGTTPVTLPPASQPTTTFTPTNPTPQVTLAQSTSLKDYSSFTFKRSITDDLQYGFKPSYCAY